MSTRTTSLWPVLGLVVVAATLGSGHVCARFAFANDVNVLTAATVRSVCASLLLAGVLRWRRTAILPLPREFRATLVIGALIAAQTVLIQVSVALLPVTLAILVFYTYPFFTGVASSLIGAERFTLPLAMSLAAAFVGLALVLGIGPERIDPLGVAAGIGASATFTAALVLTPKLAPGVGAPLRTFFTLATAAAIFVVAAVATQDFRLPSNAAGWGGLAGLAVFYALGISGLFLLLPLIGAVRATVVLNLEPVAVAAVAWITLGEALSMPQLAGAALVVAAVMLFQLFARRP